MPKDPSSLSSDTSYIPSPLQFRDSGYLAIGGRLVRSEDFKEAEEPKQVEDSKAAGVSSKKRHRKRKIRWRLQAKTI
jgi:hypothetical protein